MGELQSVSEISPTLAMLWVLYPIGALVGIELFLRALGNDDDDDDFEGGMGIRVRQQEMSPAYAPSGA
tara:strand:+ start:306 stop:509 length:204 start_codon:yes stop_codon:yes gene_type:complete